ncbi:MAG TPA: hypothetical protein VIG54_10860, partial [Lysobacter sp.]
MRLIVPTAALVAALAFPAPDAHAAARPEVDAAAQAVQSQVLAWRRDFHQFPELSNREARTSQKVAEALRKMPPPTVELTIAAASTSVPMARTS